jgi:hypothetical protein
MRNLLSFFQKAILIRAREIGRGYNTMIAHRRGKVAPFRERAVYILAKFLYLLPMPNKFIEERIESLAHNL